MLQTQSVALGSSRFGVLCSDAKATNNYPAATQRTEKP